MVVGTPCQLRRTRMFLRGLQLRLRLCPHEVLHRGVGYLVVRKTCRFGMRRRGRRWMECLVVRRMGMWGQCQAWMGFSGGAWESQRLKVERGSW